MQELEPKAPAYFAFQIYNVCPLPIITPLSLRLVELYNALGGLNRLNRPDDYYNLPAIYVAACGVIEAELREYDSGT